MNGKQRIVEQSKKWLSEAFIALMEKENYRDISITEIAEKAQLSRKTFYHSFKDKEDLIDYYCHCLFEGYFQQLVQQKPQSGEMMLDRTFDIFLHFWWEQRKALRLLIRQGLFDHMIVIWQSQATPHYREFAAPWHVEGSQMQMAYAMAFQLGGLTNVLRLWLEQEKPEPPEEIKKAMLAAARQLADSLDREDKAEHF
ncbi:MAG: TetR/AcrR family transcriptional regulator [Oenococcus sp.]|uniref:TetR/AcrR family transcriptional regulator n=1 Tax=Oenococcus sp. TaxID=1979414 RepID=UPI0039E98677